MDDNLKSGNQQSSNQQPNADDIQKGAIESMPAAPQQTGAISTPISENNYEPLHHSFGKHLAIVVVIAALLVTAIYFVHVGGNANIVHTTNITSSISPHVNNSTQQIAVFSRILSKANVMYGVPNSTMYSEFSSNTVKAVFGNIDYVEYGYTSSFGLPFTSSFMNASYTPPLNYLFILPGKYSNASYPVAVGAMIYKYKNSSEMRAFYNSSITTLNNNTYYITKNGGTSENKSSGGQPVHLINRYINVTGSALPGVITSVAPYYRSLELNGIELFYNDTGIVVMAYGVDGTYNENYTIAMGEHILNLVIDNKV